jgi:uncharacterized membrane-anchored protein
MTLDRRSALFLGVILLMNAAFMLLRSDGQVEGYVGGAICGLGGLLIVVLALGRSGRDADQDSDDTQRERSGE